MGDTIKRVTVTPAVYPRLVEFLHPLECANKFVELNLASRKHGATRPDPDTTNRPFSELASRKNWTVKRRCHEGFKKLHLTKYFQPDKNTGFYTSY